MTLTSIYEVSLFKEKGYIRKKCILCGRNFWTLNPDANYCGDQPCVTYTFIDEPPTSIKLNIDNAREKFLSFFERNNHVRIGKYPVVARWRDDVYLVGASIYDFQPWVTDGVIPPPSNPLTISQPCIRFTDIDLVGKSGRHLTEFEMMAHHAFNYPDKKIYWNDETVEYCFRFFTEEVKVQPEKINFIEDMWSGGGNAGEDFEVVIGGIEVATLVFMHYKQAEDKLIPLKIQTVDTGYGLERIVWLTNQTPTVYDAIFSPFLRKFYNLAGIKPPEKKIFAEISKLAGSFSLKGKSSLKEFRLNVSRKLGLSVEELEKIILPVETAYAIADFSRTLVFMLGDGVVPSNMGAGYLARLLIRKILRNMHYLGLNYPIIELVDFQIKEVSRSFPEYLEKSEVILDMVDVEERRFKETMQKGRTIIKRLIEEEKGKISTKSLLMLYDSHGLTPDYVSQVAEEFGVNVEIPEDFYTQIVQMHEKFQKPKVIKDEVTLRFEGEVEELPPTKLLYYEDAYLKEFKAEVLKVFKEGYVVLNQTCFYAEGGGQPPDIGILKWNNGEAKVIDVQKVKNVILHKVEGELPNVGCHVIGVIDWERRKSLMRSHTATHILIGAARKVLGDHVWQSGALKGVERSRLDISHYLRLTDEQVKEIEKLSNDIVAKNVPVKTFWLPREVAEGKYGFRLYQGGVVPGREIRIVEVENWDVEACGGTHCKFTGEIGLIKIVKTERIQDGVERIHFTVGPQAVEYVQQVDSRFKSLSRILGCSADDIEKSIEGLIDEIKGLRKNVEKLRENIARQLAETLSVTIKEFKGIQLLKYASKLVDVEVAIKTLVELTKAKPNLVSVFVVLGEKNVRVIVMVGREALKLGLHAGKIALKISKLAGGSGGGKQDFGQGGSQLPEKALEALENVENILCEELGGFKK